MIYDQFVTSTDVFHASLDDFEDMMSNGWFGKTPPPKSLFGSSRFRINQHILRPVEVKFEVNFTPIHSNLCGSR
jgi:hypothetical protein